MAVLNWFDANAVSIVNGLAFGLLYFTLAVGLSLVFGMMDVLNLAHGTLYLAGAYVAFELSDGGWLGFALAIGAGALIGVGGGALLAAMTQPLAARGHLDQALLTLGISIIGAEIFMAVSGGYQLSVAPPTALRGSVDIAGSTYPTYRLIFIAVAAVLALVVFLLFERSRLGALVRATVADRDMVRVLGVNPRKILFGVFAVGAVLAVVGGVLAGPILPPGPGVDGHTLVMSLVVIVIGGLGSVRGALVAALLVGQVDTLGRSLFPEYAAFLLFGAMLLVLTLRPQGLIPVARRA